MANQNLDLYITNGGGNGFKIVEVALAIKGNATPRWLTI